MRRFSCALNGTGKRTDKTDKKNGGKFPFRRLKCRSCTVALLLLATAVTVGERAGRAVTVVIRLIATRLPLSATVAAGAFITLTAVAIALAEVAAAGRQRAAVAGAFAVGVFARGAVASADAEVAAGTADFTNLAAVANVTGGAVGRGRAVGDTGADFQAVAVFALRAVVRRRAGRASFGTRRTVAAGRREVRTFFALQ